MLGAIIGDIVGSVYEHDNYRAKDFWPLFHSGARFTDDTVCTIAVADTLLHNKPPAETIREWGRRYWKNGGWGMHFAQWLSAEELLPAYNSYGNGAAMRVSPAGFLAKTAAEAVRFSNSVTEVTHNHPEGMKGGAATATAIFLARGGESAAKIRSAISSQYGYVNLSQLPVVSINGMAPIAPAPMPLAPMAAPAFNSNNDSSYSNNSGSGNGGDVFASIEKMAALQAKGILTPQEFATKKAELLSRL